MKVKVCEAVLGLRPGIILRLDEAVWTADRTRKESVVSLCN